MTNTQPIKPDGMAIDSPQTVKNIQALRGIAALLVLWSHLKMTMTVLCPSALSSIFVSTAFGGIGVDIFFIISGYVISLTACKRHHRPLDFFLARIARISPLYLAIFIPAFAHRLYVEWPHIPLRCAWNGLFYLPIFDLHDYTQPPLAVGWTLSFEMWFYVAFTLLLCLWKPGKVALLLPLLFVLGAGLMSFYHGAWYFPRFLFHPFVLEFSFGCVIYQTQKWVRGQFPWVLVAAGILFMLAFSRDSGFLGWHITQLSLRMDLAWWRVLVWGLPSALIVAGMVGLERNQGLVLPRALVAVGTISYSLYISHRFSLGIVDVIGSRIGLHNPFLIALVVFGLSLILAWLCWKWVERPLTSRAQKWAKRVASREIRSRPAPDAS